MVKEYQRIVLYFDNDEPLRVSAERVLQSALDAKSVLYMRFGAIKVTAAAENAAFVSDIIFVERLWRTVKYEEVYLKDYATPREARQGLTAYLGFYNERRLHQALGYRTPAAVYFGDRDIRRVG